MLKAMVLNSPLTKQVSLEAEGWRRKLAGRGEASAQALDASGNAPSTSKNLFDLWKDHPPVRP